MNAGREAKTDTSCRPVRLRRNQQGHAAHGDQALPVLLLVRRPAKTTTRSNGPLAVASRSRFETARWRRLREVKWRAICELAQIFVFVWPFSDAFALPSQISATPTAAFTRWKSRYAVPWIAVGWGWGPFFLLSFDACWYQTGRSFAFLPRAASWRDKVSKKTDDSSTSTVCSIRTGCLVFLGKSFAQKLRDSHSPMSGNIWWKKFQLKIRTHPTKWNFFATFEEAEGYRSYRIWGVIYD